MVRKLLTALDQIAERATTTFITVTSGRQALLMSRQVAQQTTALTERAVTLPLLNVQRLMVAVHLIALTRLLPMLPPRETLRSITILFPPTVEEERAIRRKTLPYRQIEELDTERAQRLRPEQVRQEIREIALSRTSINLVDQTAFCRLEQWLWQNFPLQVYQILGTLLEQSISKQWYLKRIVGLEDLQKLMLQMYIYAFMEFPLQMNLLGMKVTPLTMSVLRHRVASIYETYSIQNQQLKQRGLLICASVRKPETKGVASSKGRQEQVPLKEGIGVTKDLTEDTLVSTGRDFQGKEWFFTALRYAYSMPFWLRRRLARQFGMPENHKYARYFGIGCIPTRYARFSWKPRYYEELPFLYSVRDDYMKKLRKYESRHRAGVTRKGRYGSGRIWTHF